MQVPTRIPPSRTDGGIRAAWRRLVEFGAPNILRLLVMVFVAASALDVRSDAIRTDGSMDWWRLIVLVLCYAAIATVVWLPRIGFILTVVALLASPPNGLAGVEPFLLVVSIIAVMTLGDRVLIWLALAFSAAWVVLVSVRHRNSTLLWTLLILMLFAVFAGYVGRYLHVTQARSRREIQRLTVENEQIRQEERAGLARDLHDMVAHQISLISLQVMGHRDADDVAELRLALDRIDSFSRSALEELRAVVGALREDEPDGGPDGLSVPLRAQVAVATMSEALAENGHPLNSEVDPEIDGVGLSMQKTISRILQEASTNILRYAPAGAPCTLRIGVHPDRVDIRVANRTGSQPATDLGWQSSGWGLRGIRERVHLVGGEFEAAREGQEWTVRASLPRR